MTNEVIDFTTKYREHIGQKKTEEIVDVTAPSGIVFQFAKPSKFELVFRYGKLPQSATSSAVQSWIDAGLLKPGEMSEDKIAEIDTVLKLRDRVLDLSRFPKLVIGEALKPDELSTDDLSDDDATFLFQWCASGGEVAGMVTPFPDGRSGASPLASASKRKVRTKAKRAGGA